jgi:hypothetical protein
MTARKGERIGVPFTSEWATQLATSVPLRGYRAGRRTFRGAASQMTPEERALNPAATRKASR